MTNHVCKVTINNCEMTNYICKIAINDCEMTNYVCKVTINNCEMTNCIYKIDFALIYITEKLNETAGKKKQQKNNLLQVKEIIFK